MAIGGRSVFLTGGAGTGKSFLLRYIISELRKKYTGEGNVAVTAPTGIAAQHVGGVTIHSWSGMGLGKGRVEQIVERVAKSGPATRRWNDARVLVIDEVSMLDSEVSVVAVNIKPEAAAVPRVTALFRVCWTLLLSGQQGLRSMKY